MWKTFCYLGSWLSTNGSCDKDCQIRIGKANNVFGRLLDVWRNKHISLKVKVRLYESLVMPTMRYSAELWPLTIPQKNKKAQLSLTNARDAKACQNCSNWTCLQR